MFQVNILLLVGSLANLLLNKNKNRRIVKLFKLLSKFKLENIKNKKCQDVEKAVK